MLKAPIAVLALCLAAAAAQPSLADAPRGYARTCDNVLELLPHIVRKSAVAAIENADVVLHSICRGEQMTTFGNAGGLTRTIGQNPTLVAALRQNGWRPADVVGIQINGHRVDLYVHRNP